MKLPLSLLLELKEKLSVDISIFEEAHDQTTPISIRLNPAKRVPGINTGPKVNWASHAFYLEEKPSFTNDPLFHAGCYYVQEASSMFLEQVFKQTIDTSQNLVVLDACAAPGGKSTLLASILNDESLLVSNEVIATRIPSLVHNLVKWGMPNNLVTHNDPSVFGRLSSLFDVVIVDAPCSGSGLFRKQEDAIGYWSQETVKHCSLRQQRILTDLLPSLKQNGVLIYSTCSYSIEENESVCDFICKQNGFESLQLKLDPGWGIMETKSEKHSAYGYRFFPHLVKGEGFFITCFRKNGEEIQEEEPKNQRRKNRRNLLTELTKEEQKSVGNYIDTNELGYFSWNEEIVGCRKNERELLETLSGNLKMKKMPLHIGKLKGKDFIPHPWLAYTPFLNPKVRKTELDMEQALLYLRKEGFNLPGNAKGFELATFRNFGLGWMKNLGSRVNNYYPAEWRIIKG